jgi:hypothetical protein
LGCTAAIMRVFGRFGKLAMVRLEEDIGWKKAQLIGVEEDRKERAMYVKDSGRSGGRAVYECSEVNAHGSLSSHITCKPTTRV